MAGGMREPEHTEGGILTCWILCRIHLSLFPTDNPNVVNSGGVIAALLLRHCSTKGPGQFFHQTNLWQALSTLKTARNKSTHILLCHNEYHRKTPKLPLLCTGAKQLHLLLSGRWWAGLSSCTWNLIMSGLKTKLPLCLSWCLERDHGDWVCLGP